MGNRQAATETMRLPLTGTLSIGSPTAVVTATADRRQPELTFYSGGRAIA